MKTNAAPPPTPGDRLLVLPCGGRGNRRYAAFAPHDTAGSPSWRLSITATSALPATRGETAREGDREELISCSIRNHGRFLAFETRS
jgi:hypothetical protein